MNNEAPSQFNRPTTPKDTSAKSPESKISHEQRGAIKLAAETGIKIQQDFPKDILVDYVNGATLSELADKYEIQKKYNINTPATAKSAVSNALGGYSGEAIPSYLGLIKDPEIFRMIGRMHIQNSTKKLGERMKTEGRGMFGMNKDERKQIGSRSGMVLYQTGKGIHAQTKEEKKEMGKETAINRGFITLSKDAEDYVEGLDLSSPEYVGKRVNTVNAKKIAEEVNARFYKDIKGVTPDIISSFLWRKRNQRTSQN